MSSSGPAGGGFNPFESLFGDLARLLNAGGSGPLNWDVARQVAVLIAGEGQGESNVDPLARIALEELVHVAELHVGQVTGLSPVIRQVHVWNHIDWVTHTLDAYHDLLERLALSLSPTPEDAIAEVETGLSSGGDFLGQFSHMEKWLSPALLGMQAGGMVGHLSHRCLGQYDLPIPRSERDAMVLVPANIDAFSRDWSLPADELRLYVCIEEVTRLAVLATPHVHDRLTQLLTEYVAGFRPDNIALQDRFDNLDMSDPAAMSSLSSAAFIDPQTLLGAIQTPGQQHTLAYIGAMVCAIVGYVDHVVSTVAGKMVSTSSAIGEAVKRRRVEESDGVRLVERLFGLELHQAQFDRGDAFVGGVLERSGEAGLARLWESAHTLPTPAEIDAPGLWLERIDLPMDEPMDR